MSRRSQAAFKRGGRHAPFAFLIIVTCALAASTREAALDRYVAKPDPSYAWKLVGTIPGEGYKGYVIELTSQTWRTASEVDRPVWKHWLTVVKPDRAASNKAMLFIGGGSNRDPQPRAVSKRALGFVEERPGVYGILRRARL